MFSTFKLKPFIFSSIFLISLIIHAQNQEFNIDNSIGTQVYLANSKKDGLPNVYNYNADFSVKSANRFEDIGAQLSSKANLLARIFTIDEIKNGKFNYNRIVVLHNEDTRILYNYTIGNKNQFIAVENMSEEELSKLKQLAPDKQIIIDRDKKKYKVNYPDGIYMTQESFRLKSPDKKDIHPVYKVGSTKTKLDSIPQICEFMETSTEDIVKKCFAVSYKGYLFFRSGAIIKHRNKKDKTESILRNNEFTRVLIGGDNFFYIEYEFVNKWAHGTAVNLGPAGATLAYSMYKPKGVVWDVKNQEFDVFKSCRNYNLFLEVHDRENIRDCGQYGLPNLSNIRALINRIK